MVKAIHRNHPRHFGVPAAAKYNHAQKTTQPQGEQGLAVKARCEYKASQAKACSGVAGDALQSTVSLSQDWCSDVGYAASEESKHVAFHHTRDLSYVETADGCADTRTAETTVAAAARATKPLRVTRRSLQMQHPAAGNINTTKITQNTENQDLFTTFLLWLMLLHAFANAGRE